jgi:hypothetical protein
VGNLLLIVIGYFVYKMLLGGKTKDELAEFEKTLAEATTTDAKAPDKKGTEKKTIDKPKDKLVEKTEINLSDEDPAHIPINDDSDMDNLFPLDTMEDPNNSDNHK